MADEEHAHTPEQIARAFAHAPKVLQQLREAGVPYPSFELYADASGFLFLGYERDKITDEQYALACELVRSTRPGKPNAYRNAIAFCCGLVTAAEAVK